MISLGLGHSRLLFHEQTEAVDNADEILTLQWQIMVSVALSAFLASRPFANRGEVINFCSSPGSE